MGLTQRLVRLLPRRWAGAIERESREWKIACVRCGGERSVWDTGGVRYRASGEPRVPIRCRSCRTTSIGRIYRRRSDA
ncbi:hypothetical protein [Sphingomonas sp. G-3-2-10]|jgi:hypothetical protein|uniref:hypothetical protein n=1 Tax=Sphingomonas sp. G-3-2-10 TaxID=2728838 RepID=UPI00146AE122|nr:hypothetical protein [Sphingomonas sp. G-3-2-10]NML07318.1 hypothetical protein [Sphingomonas sp. G-3-2-10]